MTYVIITDKKKIDQLIHEYFVVVSDSLLFKALKNFSKKEGFGIEFTSFLFKNDLDAFDEAYQKLDDEHVLLSVEKPAADEDSEVYLSFLKFYEYLEKQVSKISKEKPEEKDELESLLLEVKKGLGIS